MKLMRMVTFQLAICFAAAVTGLGMQDPDLSKGIESDAFGKKRQKFNQVNVKETRKLPPRKRKYYPIRSQSSGFRLKPPTRGTELADIGFTLWKFSGDNDADGTKILREANQASLVPRRIESETALAVGDKVRIGIESGSHSGYMYVINREQYSDGTFGKSSLIFPTLRARRGKNLVEPGMLMYFPSSEEEYDVHSQTASKQHAEELIVIISPTEIVDPARLRLGFLELSDAEVNGWLGKWSVDVAKMELEDGAGEPMTEAEKAAGDQGKGLVLTQSDAVPQTLYRMRIKRGDPVLARIGIKIKRN